MNLSLHIVYFLVPGVLFASVLNFLPHYIDVYLLVVQHSVIVALKSLSANSVTVISHSVSTDLTSSCLRVTF